MDLGFRVGIAGIEIRSCASTILKMSFATPMADLAIAVVVVVVHGRGRGLASERAGGECV